MKIIKKIKFVFNQSDLIIIDKANETNRYKDLTPKEEIKNANEYIKALEWALNQQDVYNIAITGPYGSGKSSVIKTFIKKHTELKYIKISLANFEGLNVDEKDQINNKKTINLIQSSDGMTQKKQYELSNDINQPSIDDILIKGILKQLFYSVDKKRIPQSRFRKLQVLSFKKIFLFTNVLFLFILLTNTFFIKNVKNQYYKLIDISKNNTGLPEYAVLLIGLGLIVFILFLLSKIIYLSVSKIAIKEINISKNFNASFIDNNENTIFDKYIDEIVYFFESTKINVLFIEDLDRFNNKEIFIKMRELNTILNQYENIKKKIVFVYAMRDDIFIENDRTKFFDFIVSIIPVINSTNSENLLLRRVEDENSNGINIELSKEFITEMSIYINDMRILNNIYNEFIIYKETLQKAKELNLKDNIMFSIILFKNLYPKEFSEIQFEKGIIKEAFENKYKFKNTITAKLCDEKELLIEKLDQVDRDTLNNVREVKLAMLSFMTNNNGFPYKLDLFDTNYNVSSILNSEFNLEKIKTRMRVLYYDYDGYSRNCLFESEKEFSELDDYIKRIEAIKYKLPDSKRELQNQISAIDLKIQKLNGMSIKDMIKNYGAENVLPEQVRENKLLIYLLRKGYIQDDYANYINYFYPNSMTIDDMNFVLSIKNHEAKAYEYILSCIDKIIEKLETSEFEQREIYNFNLLDHLLSNDKYVDKRDVFIKQLTDETLKSWNFINQFIEMTKFQSKFIFLLCNQWKNFLNYVFHSNGLIDERKMYILYIVCKSVSSSKVIELNQDNCIKEYFENHSDILNYLTNINAEKIKEIIEGCDILFKEIDIDKVDTNLIDWIFENKKFVATTSIIKTIVTYKNKKIVENLDTKNYTTIRKLNFEPLLSVVIEDIENYIDSIILLNDKNSKEDIDAVLELINLSENIALSERLIEKEEIVLDSFEKCKFEFYAEDSSKLMSLWDKWINCNKIEYAWNNLVVYWKEFGITNSFLKYIENGIEEIVKIDIEVDLDAIFIKEVIESTISSRKLKTFISKLSDIDVDNLEIDKITDDNMKVLIDENIFDYDLEFIEKLKTNSVEVYRYFLASNIQNVINDIKKIDLQHEDIEYIINFKKITDISKKADIVIESDLESYTREIAYFLFDKNIDLNQENFKKAWVEIDLKDKYKFLLDQFDNLNSEDIAECFSDLEDTYTQLANRSSRHLVKLYKNDYNIELVQKLIEIGYITSFKENGILLECWVKKYN